MSITLTYGATTLALPEDMLWSDEYAWQAVEQSTRRSITGALLREATAKQSGRPVTLAAARDAAWMLRGTLDTLREWADIAGAVMTLELRGVDRSVIFDHARTPIDADAVNDYSDPLANDYYVVTLRFLTVPA